MPVHPDEALWFISQLRHTKGKWAGTPFTILDFQEQFIRDLLQLNRAGRRKIKKALLGIARKNGKSELGAALALTLLVCDGEPGGQVIGAAGKRDQAKLILDTAKAMVRYSKIGGRPLSDFLVVRRDRILFPEIDAEYRVVSADAEKEHGLNPHAVVFDELHVQGQKRDLWDALVTAQGARENPLLVSLTTAGPAPLGLCYDEYRYGKEVLAGARQDPELLMRWWEADADRDVDDPVAWRQANPGLDHMVYADFIRKAAQDVISGRSPEYTFRRLHLNQWTTALERWLPRNAWEDCGEPPDIPDDAEVWIGADAALRRDTYGLAVVYVERRMVDDPETGLASPQPVVHVRTKAFKPEVEGDYIDLIDVENYVLGLASRYRVQKLVYDPAYFQLMAQSLSDKGVPVEPYPQSPENMIVASETFQRLVLDRRMRHGNDRELNLQLAGVGTSESDRGVRVSKRKSGVAIDVVVALVMAVHAALGQEATPEDFAFMAG